MKRKIMSVILSSALLASVMSGCGLSTQESTTASSGSSAAASEDTAAADTSSDAAAGTSETAAGTAEDAAEEVAPIEGAESDPAVTLTMAEVNPEDTIVGQMDRKFADEVERLSGGSITVDLQASGVLGAENVVLDSMLGGSDDIDVARISAFALTSYGCTKATLLSLPYTFVSRDHFWNFAESDLATDFLEEPEELGLGVRGLFYGEEGFRHFFTKEQVTDISDFKGMKLRVSSDPVMVGLVEGLGASATNVDFTELYSALQTGVVDGAEQPVANYESNAFQEVAPYLIMDGHTLGAVQVIITDSAWDGLTENQQKAITAASEIASSYNKSMSQEKEDEVIEELKADGVTITEVEDKSAWQEATASVIEEYTKGQEDLYQQILDMQN